MRPSLIPCTEVPLWVLWLRQDRSAQEVQLVEQSFPEQTPQASCLVGWLAKGGLNNFSQLGQGPGSGRIRVDFRGEELMGRQGRGKGRQGRYRRLHDQRVASARRQVHELAELVRQTPDLELRRRYVRHIRAIAQKVQLHLSSEVKILFCRHCSTPWMMDPPTVRVRTRAWPSSHIVYTCLFCGTIHRYPTKCRPKPTNEGVSSRKSPTTTNQSRTGPRGGT